MKVALLNIGNELLLGRTHNSNATVIADRLTQLGHEVREQRSVLDEAVAMREALSALSKQCDLLLVTGGLGPTEDDKTREVVAQLLGKPLQKDAAAEAHLRELYAKRQLSVSEKLLRQICVPSGATALQNRLGSAVGFATQLGDCRLAVLPGVPWEMLAMFEEQLQPLLPTADNEARELLTVRLIGMAESACDQLAADWIQRLDAAPGAAPTWGTQIRFPEVHLIFYATTAAQKAALPTIQRFATAEAIALVDFSAVPVETLVHRLLFDSGLKLATAESCTGGYLSSRLLAQSGASAYFIGGAITYANSAKLDLGVAAATLEKHGAVSAECAAEMAAQVRLRHGADIGLAVTGILGPTGGTYDKPVGTAWAALSGAKSQLVEKFQLKRDRSLNREELTVRVLFKLFHFATSIIQGRKSS